MWCAVVLCCGAVIRVLRCLRGGGWDRITVDVVQECLVVLDQPSHTPVQRAERYIDHRNDTDGQNPNLWSLITK